MGMVIDASAVLALLLEEAGADVALSAIEEGAEIGAVNLAEVVGRLRLGGMPEEEALQVAAELPLTVVPADHEIALAAGLMLPATKPFGLSLGDRFCLALARQRKAAAVTADRNWADIGSILNIEVRVIR